MILILNVHTKQHTLDVDLIIICSYMSKARVCKFSKKEKTQLPHILSSQCHANIQINRDI